MLVAKRSHFAGLPAEFLMFSGLFFRQAQNIDVQWFVFVLGGWARPVKIRPGRILMVWYFFDVKNSATGCAQNLILRLGE